MTHPRTQIKNEISDLLATLGLPVFVSRARDLRKNEGEAILIYVTQEVLARAPGTGEHRPGLPIVRTMTVEILILTRRPGDGSEAAARGDELSRAVELALKEIPALTPVSAAHAY